MKEENRGRFRPLESVYFVLGICLCFLGLFIESSFLNPIGTALGTAVFCVNLKLWKFITSRILMPYGKSSNRGIAYLLILKVTLLILLCGYVFRPYPELVPGFIIAIAVLSIIGSLLVALFSYNKG